jgi:hypothetical protein
MLARIRRRSTSRPKLPLPVRTLLLPSNWPASESKSLSATKSRSKRDANETSTAIPPTIQLSKSSSVVVPMPICAAPAPRATVRSWVAACPLRTKMVQLEKLCLRGRVEIVFGVARDIGVPCVLAAVCTVLYTFEIRLFHTLTVQKCLLVRVSLLLFLSFSLNYTRTCMWERAIT